MDQIKIGKFIAACRKQRSLTQAQLAEKLNLTDKAVSKWETGKSMPDSSIMLELCEILDITVNDLLNGERIEMENRNQKNEHLLLDMKKELEQKNKTIWISMWVIMASSLIAMLAGVLISAFLIPEGVWQIVAIVGIVILFLLPCFFALKLEISVGVYRCQKCGCEIVPTFTEALWAMHMGTTRYLKCPNCQKHAWCKKVFKK